MNIRLNVRIILIVNLVFLTVYSYAQDIYFSQLHTVPQLINPAATGITEPGMRLTNNYRNQWRQIDFPYVTDFISAEGSVKFLGQTLGIGGYFIHDHSSNLYLTADKVYFSLSYSRYIGNHQIVLGVQPGWVLKSLDSRSISFGSQFDPDQEAFITTLPSGENLLEDGMNYFDLNAGIFWRSKINQAFTTAGLSVQHINKPVESFYTRNDSTQLPMKLSLHGSITFPVGEGYNLQPHLLFSSTSGSSELLCGLIATYYPNIRGLAVNHLLGLFELRMDPFQNIDAIIVGAGMGYLSFDLCANYDFTVSSLSQASRFQRAFEVSLIYHVIRKKTPSAPEPCFML